MGETETPLGSSTGSVHIQSHSRNWAGGALISGRWFSGGLDIAKGFKSPTGEGMSLNQQDCPHIRESLGHYGKTD